MKLNLTRAASLLFAVVRSGISDLLFLLAVAAVLYGAWQIYRPAAWILAGVALMVVAFAMAVETPTEPTQGTKAEN